MFKLNQKSIEKLNQVEPKLKLLTEEVIKATPYNFIITKGLRDLKTQQEYFKKGTSRCDGINNKSKHQANSNGLSEAIDIMCYNENGKATWEKKYYIEMAKVFKETAIELNKSRKAEDKINIRWGGDFKGFFDGPHFELIK